MRTIEREAEEDEWDFLLSSLSLSGLRAGLQGAENAFLTPKRITFLAWKQLTAKAVGGGVSRSLSSSSSSSRSSAFSQSP